MVLEREPLLYVVVGRKKIGKSTTTMVQIRDYNRGNPAKGVPGRRALIFDAQNEYSDKSKFPDIKAIDIMQVALFSRHMIQDIRRVPAFLRDGREMSPDQKARAVNYILENYRNGLLLLEDINNYIGDHINSEVIGTILSQRHKGIDMMLHYHSFGRIQKKVWPHINFIRMHKCGDSVRRNKDKFEELYEGFQIAENIVNAQFNKGNIRFYLFIDCDLEKIHADVTTAERDEAIREYINEYSSDLLNPLLKQKNADGGKIFNWHSAFESVRKRITMQYFSDDTAPETPAPTPAPAPAAAPSPAPAAATPAPPAAVPSAADKPEIKPPIQP